MKKYVFFTYSVVDIGGSLQYIYNKIKYIKNKGYDVYVFSSRHETDTSKLIIKSFSEYLDTIYPEIDTNINYFSKSQRKKFLNKIKKDIDYQPDDEIIIESHDINTAIWGELFAKEVNGKNFCYFLQEQFKFTRKQQEFSYFKFKRHECTGIKEKSLSLLFKGFSDDDFSGCHLSARCSNVTDNIPSPIEIDKSKYDIVIGTIGRLLKPFVYPTLERIAEFIDSHKDKNFYLLLIGYANKEDVDKIYNLFFVRENATVNITGAMYPISKDLIKSADVFFASAGSTRVSASEGVPTIAISSESYTANGVIAYTTNESVYDEPTPHNNDIGYWLEEILFKDFTSTHEIVFKQDVNTDEDIFKTYDEHLHYLDNSSKEKEYYDLSKLMVKKYAPVRAFNTLFGYNATVKLVNKLK